MPQLTLNPSVAEVDRMCAALKYNADTDGPKGAFVKEHIKQWWRRTVWAHAKRVQDQTALAGFEEPEL